MNNIIWNPQSRQAAFMARPEDEALYGGAAGGGKSDALVIEATRQVHIPHYKALILRKTFPQLTELIDKSLKYYPQSITDPIIHGVSRPVQKSYSGLCSTRRTKPIIKEKLMTL